jgi:hypothetical protein
MLSASVAHLDQARMFEARGQKDDALREYRRASEYDPPNRQVAGKVAEMERGSATPWKRSRPPPAASGPGARPAPPAPLASLEQRGRSGALQSANLRDVINTLAELAGISVQYERDFQDRTVSLTLDRVTLGEALQQVLTNSGNFYKVVNQRTILVIPDNRRSASSTTNRWCRRSILSHSDAAEVRPT